MLVHNGTLQLETKRLILRRFTDADSEDMFNNWANDSDVTRCLSWKPHGTIQVTKEIISSWVKSYEKQDFYNWAIVLKDYGKVIGSIGVVNIINEHLWCEIGYCIGKKYWSKGIMTEALNKIIEYLIIVEGFNRVQAIHHLDNPASGKVMLHAGMKHEGRLRHYFFNNQGNFVDCEMYSIIKEEYRVG